MLQDFLLRNNKNMFKNLINKATGGLEGIIDELLKTAHDKIKEKVKESFSIHKLKELKKIYLELEKLKPYLIRIQSFH